MERFRGDVDANDTNTGRLVMIIEITVDFFVKRGMGDMDYRKLTDILMVCSWHSLLLRTNRSRSGGELLFEVLTMEQNFGFGLHS